jgi:carbon-monoxide dehydrogenase medium subunit
MSIPAYTAPATLADALSIKGSYGADARVIAGGTDLILRMRDKVYTPKMLLDLRRLGLNTMSRCNDEMHLGAFLSHAQILASSELMAVFPALVEACRPFAGPPIRNRGTVGGNLVNASPAADLVPPLMAYDASVLLVSSTGQRLVPLTGFFTGPGKTVLQADEILTQIRLPLPAPRTAAHFFKLGQRRSMAISVVNLAARLTLDAAGTVDVARICLGSVAPTAIRALGAEGILQGSALSSERIGQAADAASAEISPIDDVRSSKDYRKHVTGVMVRRALTAVWSELEGNRDHA